jgi:hypothetical protein
VLSNGAIERLPLLARGQPLPSPYAAVERLPAGLAKHLKNIGAGSP